MPLKNNKINSLNAPVSIITSSPDIAEYRLIPTKTDILLKRYTID